MKWKILNPVKMGQLFRLALIAALHIPKQFQIAESGTALEDGSKNHVFFVEGKINYEA